VAVPGAVRRLSNFEYAATVSDVLGVAAPAPRFVDGSFYGFDNMSDVAFMQPDIYGLLLDMAEEVASATFASAELKGRVVTCQEQDDSVCIRAVVAGVGLKIFRRPLLDEELPVYEKVYARAREQGELHEGALKQTLIALLASAQFLYRMELVGDAPGIQPLGPYELATRLSYLLWSSAPDDALLNAAKASALAEPEQLEGQVSRMWSDPKSARFVPHFAGQWLDARRISESVFDPVSFPDWNPEVAAAAERELYTYFDDFVRGEHSYLDFLKQKTHYANAALGKFYRLDLSGAELRPVEMTGDREGFLGLVAYLASTSHPSRTSVMLRGRYIVSQLLCVSVPPPPANIDTDVAPIPEPRTERQHSELIRQDPKCAQCHDIWDPLGIALEHYDSVGTYRETYTDGQPIDTVLTSRATKPFPNGLQLSGLSSVADVVTQHPSFKPCLAEEIYMYGLGRAPGADVDQNNIEALSAGWSTGALTIKELVRRLVVSPMFRFRSDGANK
jgi:hypothetical protein